MKRAVYACNLGEFADVRRLAQVAFDVEAAGYDGFFVTDCLLPTADPGHAAPAAADVQVALTAIALATTSIKFGAMVTPLPRRRPVKFARELLTLDALSGGRLIAGAGSGSEVVKEFENLGETVEPRLRADALDESLLLIDALLRGGSTTFEGQHVTARDTILDGPRVAVPRVPIWVGGSLGSLRPLRRAARWDGIFAMSRDLGAIAPQQVAVMRDYIVEHRTMAAPFDIAIAASFPDNSPQLRLDMSAAYEQAGVTWWVEYAWSPAQAYDLVDRGPLSVPVLAETV